MAHAPLYKNPFRRASSVPVIGPWIGHVGRTIQIASHPCQVQPEIWVNALFRTAPLIFFSLIKPSPTDYLAERASLTGRKKQKQKFSIWAATSGIGPGGSEAAWYMFKGLQLARAAGYYMTVADAITKGMVNWTSTAYRWSGCVVPDGAAANGHILADSVQLLPPGRILVNTWVPELSQFMVMDGAGITVPSNQIASIGFSLTSRPNTFGFPDAPYSLHLVNLNNDQEVAAAVQGPGADGTRINTGYYANGMLNFRSANKLISGGRYVVYCDKGFGVVQWSSGTMSGTSSPLSDALTPDP